MSEDDITQALSGIDTRLALLEGMMQLISHRGQHGPDHAPQGGTHMISAILTSATGRS
jgi:hypothetical protein